MRTDDVVGLLYGPSRVTILGPDGEGDFEEVLVPPVFLPARIVVSERIDELQEARQEMALLTGDDGDEVVGMVTISDAFEVIAGEVEDPLDRM